MLVQIDLLNFACSVGLSLTDLLVTYIAVLCIVAISLKQALGLLVGNASSLFVVCPQANPLRREPDLAGADRRPHRPGERLHHLRLESGVHHRGGKAHPPQRDRHLQVVHGQVIRLYLYHMTRIMTSSH